MEKTYERINWKNYPSVVTPINEKNLNKMDQALDEVDNRVIGLDTAKLDKSTANTMIKDLEVDETTGIFTITYLNGTVKKVDTGLEKIATNFKYNKDTQKLVLTLTDGTEQEVDLSSLISQYEFTDSDTIAFTIGADGKVTATIKAGSITEDMLQPNFLADVKVEVEKAKTYSNSASNSSNEAKQYRDEAEQFRNEASMFAPEGYEDLVKNVSDNTVKIDTIIEKAELNIKNNAKGSNIHLTDSAEANVVSLELYGKTEQNAYTGKNLLDCRGLTEQTTNGVTFTPVYDDNGNLLYVNANGTASANAIFELETEPIDKTNTYIFNGCPSGGSTSSYRMTYTEWDASWNWLTTSVDTGEGILLTHNDSVGNASFRIEIASGTTVSNLKFYPMISLEGGEYEPYVGGKPSPSPDYPQEIKSVKGKNLLDCRGLTETTTNGVKFTPKYDSNGNLEYINVNGTATAQASYYLMPTTPFEKGNYIFNGCPSGGSGTTYLIYNDVSTGSDTGNGKELNLTDTTNVRLRIVIGSGYTANNLKFYPMIRPSSITDGTYVPYGLLRFKTSGGKNLAESSVNGGLNPHYTALFVEADLKPNTTYTLSFKGAVGNSYYINDKIRKNGTPFTVQKGVSSVTFTTSENLNKDDTSQYQKDLGGWLFLKNWEVTNSSHIFEEVQIEEGTLMTEYQPYQTSEITLSKPIELNGINGVYDVVTSECVTRRFGKVVFDGSSDEYWERQSTNTTDVWRFRTQYIRSLVLPYASRMWCSHYKNVGAGNTWNKVEGCSIDGDGWFVIYDEKFISATADDFKAHLAENPMTIVYELATPTTEALQSDFTALKTFYPETYVSNDADCDMSITYTADAKNYIDNKIALLTTAIYNNI